MNKRFAPFLLAMVFFLSFHAEAQVRGGSRFSRPYDSTQGVPGYVFAGFWIIIILFLVRLGWEYRDEIFKKKKD